MTGKNIPVPGGSGQTLACSAGAGREGPGPTGRDEGREGRSSAASGGKRGKIGGENPESDAGFPLTFPEGGDIVVKVKLAMTEKKRLEAPREGHSLL